MHPPIFPQQFIEFDPHLFQQREFLQMRQQALEQSHLPPAFVADGVDLGNAIGQFTGHVVDHGLNEQGRFFGVPVAVVESVEHPNPGFFSPVTVGNRFQVAPYSTGSVAENRFRLSPRQ